MNTHYTGKSAKSVVQGREKHRDIFAHHIAPDSPIHEDVEEVLEKVLQIAHEVGLEKAIKEVQKVACLEEAGPKGDLEDKVLVEVVEVDMLPKARVGDEEVQIALRGAVFEEVVGDKIELVKEVLQKKRQ